MLVYFNDFQVQGRTHHFHSGDFSKDALWSKSGFISGIKICSNRTKFVNNQGVFCGKCYDSAGLVGALSCILLHIATFLRLSFHTLVKLRCFTSLWTHEFNFTILWNICVFFTNISVWMSGGVHCGGVLLSTVAKEKEVFSGGNFQDFFSFLAPILCLSTSS